MDKLRAWLIEQMKWETDQRNLHASAWAENGRGYHHDFMVRSEARANAFAMTIEQLDKMY